MSNFGPGAYTVTPSKPDMSFMSSNGIFSNDASLIARHIVGLIILTPTQLNSAKVSGFSEVSSFDAGLIARWIVGINDAINQTGEWKFTPVNRMYSAVNADQSAQDYAARLMGDVNGDWVAPVMRGAQPQAERREPSKDAVIVSMPNATAAPKSEVVVPFRIDNLAGKNVTSYQFDLLYDPSVIVPAHAPVDLAGTLSEALSVTANSPTPGLLKVVVYGATPTSGDGEYVNVRFTVTGGNGSSSPLTIDGFRFNDGIDEATAVHGQLVVSDSSSGATLRGRLFTATGSPVIAAQVIATGTSNRSQTSFSDQFGNFQIGNLLVGEMYTVRVQSKSFWFSPSSVSFIDNITDLDLIADQ
jgi:hypothetical protein